ncbi:coiled-coil domain-containing protein [Cupriavidus alkaliphilus]|uniref:hypothetical protein n=1 Tax=Cupriavidus alkaliphilus TaxID=942866 RepID=UPI00339D9203
MNKILIVGHPTSRYQDVESLLNDCGMSTALPSRREGLSPSEIGTMLLKAHGVPLLTRDMAGDLHQIEASPLWHGMALDLMLGNLDQPLWGWADPHAVHLLDYWKTLDPSIAFILVYDTPRSLLTQAVEAASDLTSDQLRRLIANWIAYNGQLLHFYHRNVDRALLVHAQQVQFSAKRYVQQVRARVGAPLRVPLDADMDEAEPEEVATATPRAEAACFGTVISSVLKNHLADTLIREFPQAEHLYEELQAIATLPLAEQIGVESTAFGAWRTATRLDAQVVDLQATVTRLHKELESSQLELEQRQTRIDSLLSSEQRVADRVARLQAMSQELADRTRLAEGLASKLKQAEEKLAARREIEKDNQVILTQLHLLQEELEDRYLEGKQQCEHVKEMESRLEQQQRIERENAQLLPQLEQVKKELQRREVEFSNQSKKLESLLASEKLANERAHAAEERVQRQQDLVQENEILLTQLHHVQKELERYHLENRSLALKTQASGQGSGNSVYYGAVDRVKKHLSYRLGATMIDCSRSFRGWLCMPWALLCETRQFRAEISSVDRQKRPPLSEYGDADEAERVKRHLSYRLGVKLLANARSPIGWLKLPFLLRREVIAFKLEKSSQQ